MKLFKKFRKTISVMLALIFTLNMTGAVPVDVFAENMKTYIHDGYTVEYAINGEWTGNQNIQITLTNTGEDTISNWALGYEAGGAINGLWNAQVYGQQENQYILKNAGYNSEIRPGANAVFGYTLSGEDFKLPEDIVICSKRVDITEGVDIYYNMDSDYGYSFLASVTIANNSDTPIEAWQLSFDTAATFYSVWNATLLSGGNGHYTVGNDWNTSVINAHSSATFNINGGKENGADLVIENFTLNGVIIPLEFDFGGGGEDEDEDEDEDEIVLTAEAYYDIESGLVTVNWESTETNGVFEILASYDEENFNIAGTIENSNTYSFAPDEFELLYIKVKQTLDERTAESEVCFVVNTAEAIDWDDLTDTDEDDLPDVYEKYIYKTDPENPDIDSDGLPDGYEALYLETDPAVIDTDENGISDGNEDFDEDGLTNYEEYTCGTNPFSPDSDGDGLSDYDEINIYFTDPINYDTDGDKVTDGDEIELGLDPNNSSTGGIPDSEKTFEQTVETDSEALEYINSIEDNPFEVSIEIESAGVAGNNISASESGYSYQILQNEAVLGIVPEFTYSEGLKVSDVVISFNLDGSAIPNTLGVYEEEEVFKGINRFNVFKMFEDTNMLLPIETFYDSANNRVYTHVDELGTYCLIDMEQWIYSLENMPAGDYYESEEESQEEQPLMRMSAAASVNSSKNETNPPANIVFCIDTREIVENFDEVKQSMKDISEDVLKRYSDVNIYFYTQNTTEEFKTANAMLKSTVRDEYYFTDFAILDKAVDAIEKYAKGSTSDIYDFVTATQFVIEKCAEDNDNITLIYHLVKGEKVMSGVNKAKVLSDTIRDNSDVYVSLLCLSESDDIAEFAYAKWLCEYSGGIIYPETAVEETEMLRTKTMKVMASSNVPPQVYGYKAPIMDNIKTILGEGANKNQYKILSPLSLNGLLDFAPISTLREDNFYIVNGIKIADYDKDGVSDWNEVDTEFVIYNARVKSFFNIKDEIPTQYLPSIVDCMDYYSDLYYVKGGLESYVKYLHDKHYMYGKPEYRINENVEEELKLTKILPIKSDPTSEDGDGDGYVDGSKDINQDGKINDPRQLINDVKIIELKNPDFVDIIDGTTHYYGGNQGWYNDWYNDSFYSSGGCGLVAAANILAYMSASNIKYKNLYLFPSLKKEDYGKLMRELTSYIEMGRMEFGNDKRLALGIWPISTLESGLLKYAKSCSINLKPNGLSSMSSTKESMTNLIINGLMKDKPIAMLIGLNSKLENIKCTYPNGSFFKQDFERHWVTITEIEIDGIAKTNLVKVSTWGTYAYIDLDDFIDGEKIYCGLTYFE